MNGSQRVGTPLLAVFAFTFLNSFGSMVVNSGGLYFLTKGGYGFPRTMQFLMGVVIGLAYIAGALASGKIVASLRANSRVFSERLMLGGLMVAMAALCALPQVSIWLASPAEGSSPPTWPIWTCVLAYSPLTGALWPVVESYVSGGRSGDALRRAVGRWNITWSSAGVLALIGVGQLAAHQAPLAVLLVGVTHLLAGGLLLAFPRSPAEHVEGEHEPHPPVYAKLLVTFRLLLPLGYLVSSALSPYLPEVTTRLGLPVAMGALATTAWLIPRVVMFIVMERWAGWHGRWFVPIAGAVLLLAGFTGAVLAGRFGSNVGIAVLIGGLATFGIGMAVVYSGALYYAMEVGQAEVDAGGKHEALIGTGYTLGPLVGWAASSSVDRGWMAPGSFDPAVLGVVGVFCIAVAAMVARKVLHHTSTPS